MDYPTLFQLPALPLVRFGHQIIIALPLVMPPVLSGCVDQTYVHPKEFLRLSEFVPDQFHQKPLLPVYHCRSVTLQPSF